MRKIRKSPQLHARKLVALTVDELQFAMCAAQNASEFRTPRPSLLSKPPIRVGDAMIALTNHPINHAAGAIFDAFSHDRAKGDSALYRIMLLLPEIMQHRHFKDWSRRTPAGELEVPESLLAAVATVPMTRGPAPPTSAAFRLARRLQNAADAAVA